MTPVLAALNLVLGSVYTGYGVLTILELKSGWRTNGVSHFGLAWIAMAFTCGPHHLEHGLHLAAVGRSGGIFDLAAVVVGLPAGVTWFLLRCEANMGGRGDRELTGDPWWIRIGPQFGFTYAVAMSLAAAVVLALNGASFNPRLTPNVLLVGLYLQVGYYLLRTQVQNHAQTGTWSLSGTSLTVVFPTCALMHGAWLLYASIGQYDVDVHGRIIDWLSVPAAVYFVWVVRALHRGTLHDWNDGSTGAVAIPVAA